MRGRAWALSGLLLAGCGQQPVRETEKELSVSDVSQDSSTTTEMSSNMMSPPSPTSAPGISVTAAPGVAFNYRYAFRLPGPRISATQEAHAQMCEKLGLARCRITGMRYRLENERDISAALELKLDPGIAREFGKAASALVARSEGMLVDQEISGVDAGASITDANRREARAADDLARVEAELRRAGLSNATRDRLLAEAAELRAANRSTASGRDADRESLARTPMAFAYGSGSLIPGFDTTSPIRDAFEQAGVMFLGAAAFILMLLAALLPWALLAGLALWLVRRFKPGWPRSTRRVRATPEELDPASA